MPEISAIVFELLAVGTNNPTEGKEPHYFKSWNKIDLAVKTKSSEYSVAFEAEYCTTKNKFLEMGKYAISKRFK